MALWLMGIMGTLAIWVVSANTDCWTYYWATAPDQDSIYASGIVYWCDNETNPWTPIPIITIYWKNWNDQDVWITIKAMNEWTWTVKIWSWDNSEAFWSFYQWWNNYPFSWKVLTWNGQINTQQYGPSNYYIGEVFLMGTLDWSYPVNLNLWWWSGDNMGLNWFLWFDTWSFTVVNPLGRQAMCPTWYHIPSAWEWFALLNLWTNNTIDYKTDKFNFTYSIYDDQHMIIYDSWNASLLFRQDMLIPNSYTKNWDTLQDTWPYSSLADYWSSSPLDQLTASRFYSNPTYGFMGMGTARRRDGMAVRCFKNSYAEPASTFTLTFIGSGQGSISTWSVEAEEWSSIFLDNGAGSITIAWTVVATGIANEWYVFSWWLTDCGAKVTTTCNFTGEFKPITYNVQFTWTDVSWTMANQDFEYDSGQALNANAFTKTGYIFSGWIYGNTWYANQAEVLNLTWTSGAVLTFTADWTPITYTISFSWNAADATWIAAIINAEYDSGDIAPDNTFTLTGYTFTGWNTESDGSGTWYATWAELKNLTTTSGKDVKLYAQWEVNVHKLNFVVDGANIQSGDVAYSSGISAFLPSEPKKDCNSFAWWTSNVEWLTTTWTMPDSDVTFTANWNYTCSRSSWWGGSSRSSSSTANTQDSSTSSQNDDKTQNSSAEASEWQDNTQVDSSVNASEWQHSEEFQKAYEFASKNGITTMDTIEKANMDKPLTRIAMAKMLSYYAINLLWMKPDETRINKFNDIPKELDKEYDSGVTLAYQLWIMWINMPKNRFRPNDLVTRAEFATALSRMLYKIADWKDKYYSTHLAKLMEEKIITNDNPNLQELRGYVMIMLMRSAK